MGICAPTHPKLLQGKLWWGNYFKKWSARSSHEQMAEPNNDIISIMTSSYCQKLSKYYHKWDYMHKSPQKAQVAKTAMDADAGTANYALTIILIRCFCCWRHPDDDDDGGWWRHSRRVKRGSGWRRRRRRCRRHRVASRARDQRTRRHLLSSVGSALQPGKHVALHSHWIYSWRSVIR